MPRDIEYASNTHNVMLVIASAKNLPKTERDIQYICFGKLPRSIRMGLDALERRGFLHTGTVVTRQNRQAIRGKVGHVSSYEMEAYSLSAAGLQEVQRLAGKTPSRSTVGDLTVSDFGRAKSRASRAGMVFG